MLKKLLKKNLKSEKGLTGIDIVVASTIIIMSVSVVIAIFVNITRISRNVTRNAGATKMATNIVENIELDFYEDVLAELNRIKNPSIFPDAVVFTEASGSHFPTEGIYRIDGSKLDVSDRIFSTKIPRGYRLEIEVSNYYGYKIEANKDFDLVKKIEVNVLFNVGGIEQKVSLSTIKAREILKTLANDPVYSEECNVNPTTTNKKIFDVHNNPNTIKLKVIEAPAYEDRYQYDLKAAEGDKNDYSYLSSVVSDKNSPAMVVDISDNVDGESSINHYYDTGAKKVVKYTSGGSTTKYKSYVYVWVPTYIKSGNNITYRYKDTGFSTGTVNLRALDNTESVFYTVNKAAGENVFGSSVSAEVRDSGQGKWVRLDKFEAMSEKSFYKY